MSTAGETWQTRPTFVETLRRRTIVQSAEAGALLASCIDCNAHAHEWQRLLGRGARFFAAPGDASRMVVQCPSACGVCGSDAIIVTAR